jgi:DNA mismatch repair ATPase MutS
MYLVSMLLIIILESTLESFSIDLIRISPAEVIIDEFMSANAITDSLNKRNLAVSLQPNETFDLKRGRKRLDNLILNHYASGSNISQRDAARETRLLSANPVLEQACGAILNYLARSFNGLEDIIRFPTHILSDQVMQIDLPVYSALELSRTMYDNKQKGTVIHVMDQSVTAQGSRLLQSRISMNSKLTV